MQQNIEQITQKTGFTGEDLKVLRDLTFEDFIRLQVVSCLNVLNNRPETFYGSVAGLERLLKDELTDDYYQKVKELEEEAKKRYPRPESESDRRNWVALQKFGLLMSCLKKKTPQETVLEIP